MCEDPTHTYAYILLHKQCYWMIITYELYVGQNANETPMLWLPPQSKSERRTRNNIEGMRNNMWSVQVMHELMTMIKRHHNRALFSVFASCFGLWCDGIATHN